MSLTNFIFICPLIVCLGFSPYNAPAPADLSWQNAGPTLRLDPAVENVELGHTFTVNVMVDSATNLGAFQFDMIYDPAVVTVTNVELGPFLASTGRAAQPIGLDIDNTIGKVTFGAFSFGSNAGPEGTGLLAILTFAAAGSGSSTLNLQNVVMTDAMANTQLTSVEGGTVTVSAPTPTSTATTTPNPTAPPTATPTPTNTATATKMVNPAPTFTPTNAATAVAADGTTISPTALPFFTETATPVPTTKPTPTDSSPSTPARTNQPDATTTGIPSLPPGTASSRTPTARPQPSKAPEATAVTVEPLSPTPSAVLSQTPPAPPQPSKDSTAALNLAESPTSSPVPLSSPAVTWPIPPYWLLMGGIFLLTAGYIVRALLRRQTK